MDTRPTRRAPTRRTLIIIAVFSIAQIGSVKDFARRASRSEFDWPGSTSATPTARRSQSMTFNFNWLAAAGTLLLISGLLTILVAAAHPAAARCASTAHAQPAQVGDRSPWPSVLALAYVMNLSGQTITLGLWIAGAGGILAFLSPIIGWLGVAVTGSDTSSNSLFGALQVTAAKDAGLSPTLMAAANSSGGVLGKMISPQNLASAPPPSPSPARRARSSAACSAGASSCCCMCVIVYLQSTAVLGWMVVGG